MGGRVDRLVIIMLLRGPQLISWSWFEVSWVGQLGPSVAKIGLNWILKFCMGGWTGGWVDGYLIIMPLVALNWQLKLTSAQSGWSVGARCGNKSCSTQWVNLINILKLSLHCNSPNFSPNNLWTSIKELKYNSDMKTTVAILNEQTSETIRNLTHIVVGPKNKSCLT